MKFSKIRPFIIIAIITLAAEIFLFNYKSIGSLMNNEVKIDDFTIGAGLLKNEDGNYEVIGAGSYIEIARIKEHVENVHIDAEIIDGYGYDRNSHYNGVFDVMSIDLYANDDANAQYFKLGERNVLHSVSQSQYMVTHLSGITEHIKINFNEATGTVFKINSLSYNARIPFHISVLRLFAVFAVLSVLYLLKPGSWAYSVMYDSKSTKQTILKLALCAVMVGIFFTICNANPYFVYPRWEHHYQYQMLAEAFSNGEVSLPYEPSAGLAAMENPYDTALRNSLGIEYKWDRAYYDGKYYVYYGVLPELIFYWPCYKLTGMDFSTNAAIYITGIFLIAGVFFFMESLVMRWFKKTPFILYMLAVWMMVTGCGALAVMMRPDFYSLPIIMAVALSLWGLGCWIRSVNDEGKMSKSMLAAGSTCMALVAASRPQLLLVSFVAVPLFFDEVFRKKMLIIGKKLGNTIAFVLPYVLVAAGVMYYNYIRFGSPFDFGANYNLTTNDMTHRGFKAGRTFLGLFYFLFQVPQVGAVFPFVRHVSVETSYLGTTITELMCGGIIACNMWLLPVVLAFARKKEIWKDRKVLALFYSFVISGIVIIIADTQMAGVLARYIMDFGWIFFVAAAIVIFAASDYIQNKGLPALKKAFAVFMMVAFVQGMFYNFMRIFIKDTESVMEGNPEFYYTIMHLVAFWM
ncbi:MAG: hypothetical protein PUE71_06125 [Clostridia bacterium]|nr:hypothetical protein [Clostridia bacterium]